MKKEDINFNLKKLYPWDENNQLICIDYCRVLLYSLDEKANTVSCKLIDSLPEHFENHEKLREKYGKDKLAYTKIDFSGSIRNYEENVIKKLR